MVGWKMPGWRERVEGDQIIGPSRHPSGMTQQLILSRWDPGPMKCDPLDECWIALGWVAMMDAEFCTQHSYAWIERVRVSDIMRQIPCYYNLPLISSYAFVGCSRQLMTFWLQVSCFVIW